ncbi:hypothetical protein EOM86_02980 [Candidatus Nomurabacteria bacterium]|nr:hypothetical protein [Candidatus Nomurabacteria bacterium]
MEIKYTHTKASIDKISDLSKIPSSKLYGISVGEIVCYRDGSGTSNLNRIYSAYTPEVWAQSEATLNTDIATSESILPDAVSGFIPKFDNLMTGTELIIPSEFLYRNIPIARETKAARYGDAPFLADKLIELLGDEGFVPYRLTSGYSFVLSDVNPSFSVFIWCRALGEGDHLTGKLVDISPYILSLTMSKERMNGNFSMNLSYKMGYTPVDKPASRDPQPRYREMPISAISPTNSFSPEQELESAVGLSDAIINRIRTLDGVEARHRNLSIFQNVVAKNDIVFIRTSKLRMEPVKSTEIFDFVYDMIGVVETVRETTSASGDVASVVVAGGDLTNLLMADGTSIFNELYVSGKTTKLEKEMSSDIFRLFDKHVSMFQFREQTLRDKLTFVLDFMTQTTICTNLFDKHPQARLHKMDIGEGSTLVPEFVRGIWRGFDVDVDPAIEDRLVFGGEIGNAYSPIIDQINSICPRYLVELSTDTYGNKFNITARKPPFDRVSVWHYIKNIENGSLVKRIHEGNIINDAIEYSTQAFTWYKLVYNAFVPLFKADLGFLIPVKHFPEYADIFGDRPLVVNDPFVDYTVRSELAGDGLLGGKMLRQCVDDFKFIIETNAYIPFTRAGSMVINGDRTIKRGTWVYLENTREIAYVESVAHSVIVTAGIDYTTTLGLSRIMLVDEFPRYFQLIDMPVTPAGDDALYISNTITSWVVNKEHFNYFIKRRQYR